MLETAGKTGYGHGQVLHEFSRRRMQQKMQQKVQWEPQGDQDMQRRHIKLDGACLKTP